MALIVLCLGWLAGTYLGLASGAGAAPDPLVQEAWPWLTVLVCLAFAAGMLGRSDRVLRLTAFALIFALLGIWRAYASLPDPNPTFSSLGVTAFHGSVVERPEPRDTTLQLVVETDWVRRGEIWEPSRTRILLRIDRYESWRQGDILTAHGELRDTAGPGPWSQYLARRGIFSTSDFPRIEREAPPHDVDPLRALDEVRGRLDQLCARLLPEPQASLLAGILVGGRAGMPQDFEDALNVTGTSHLVAVSGFNVTVVAGVAQMLALRFFARRRATLLAIAAVWAYAVLTGLPPSALRAAIMATMALGSVLAGRDSDSLPFLLLSAALMTVHDPLLTYDLGFQLSFLATAGLILLEPALRSLLARLPGALGKIPAWLASSFTVTVAAQLATMPVIISSFHSLSLVSPITNLLIAPALPGLMLSGALAVGLGALFEPLGHLAAPVAWVYLSYLIGIVNLTADLPRASIATGSLESVQMSAYYLVLLGVALWPMPEFRGVRDRVVAASTRAPRWAVLSGFVVAGSLAILTLSSRPDGKLHIYFLEVGHGDATLIRTSQGHSILVDGGPSPTNLENALGKRMGFLDRSLDAVVLTGFQQDRLSGLIETARRHPIGLAIEPAGPGASRAAAAWAEVVAERQIQVRHAEAGDRLELGDGSYLEVAWSPDREAKEPALAVRIVCGAVSALLPGDLPQATQQELGRGQAGRVDLLRVPGQGAAGSLDERFVRAIKPKVAILSVASGNRFGHPADSTMQLLANSTIFRTDRHGTVEVVIDGSGGYEVYTER